MSDYTENLASIVWRNPEFLSHFGGLTAENVMDYFSESPFWDRQSTNQALRMQTMYAVGQGILNEAEELLSTIRWYRICVGILEGAFDFCDTQEAEAESYRDSAYRGLLHHEQQRLAPDLYSVLSGRLLSSIHSFRSSLDLLRDKAPLYDPRIGYQWQIEKPAQITEKAALQEAVSANLASSTSTPAPSANPNANMNAEDKSKKRLEDYNAEAMLFQALATTAKSMNA